MTMTTTTLPALPRGAAALSPIPVTVDGDDCFQVPLVAKGEGRTFLIDAATWLELRAAGLPERWNITGPRKGYVIAASAREAADTDSDLPRSTPRYLARIITGAGPDQAVRYRNGNSYDLRRRNLALMAREGFLPFPSKRGWKIAPKHRRTTETADA